MATATTRDTSRITYWALLAFTLLVAAVTFVLSFSGLDDYGRRVAGLGHLSPLVPIGVDGLTLCAVAATLLLAQAPPRVRLYAWSVFGIAVGASVAGNLSHAAAKGLSWEGRVGAAAWPILLAFTSHLVVVVRRHMRHPARATGPDEPAPPKGATRAATPLNSAAANTPPAAPRQPARKGGGRTRDDVRDRGVALLREGLSPAKVATEVGRDRATVYRWQKGLKGSPAATRPALADQPPTTQESAA